MAVSVPAEASADFESPPETQDVSVRARLATVLGLGAVAAVVAVDQYTGHVLPKEPQIIMSHIKHPFAGYAGALAARWLARRRGSDHEAAYLMAGAAAGDLTAEGGQSLFSVFIMHRGDNFLSARPSDLEDNGGDMLASLLGGSLLGLQVGYVRGRKDELKERFRRRRRHEDDTQPAMSEI